METSTQTYNDPTIATQAKNLTKAIFQHESGMNYNATGDAGTSKGAGQWQPGTWKAQAKDVLGDEKAPMTPENQSVVAQGTIRKLIAQGKNAAQIAAIWNSGSDKGWEKKVGTTTINGQQIKYNVPKYVKDVTDLYQQYKTQTPQDVSQETQPKEGFLSSLAKGIVEPVATTLARPIQAGAELLGASAEDVNKATKNIAGDWVAPVPQTGTDVLKDVGRAAQTVALGMPVGSIPKAIGMGAVAGAGAGLEQKGTLGGAVEQGALGAGLGLAGGGISKLLEKIPTRLTQDAFRGLSPEQAQNVLANKSIGKVSTVLEQSNNAIKDYGSKLGNALNKDAYKNVIVNADNVFSNLANDPKISQQLIDTGLNLDQIASKIKKIAPLKSNLIDKFFNEGLSIPELHRLNSALGDATFKSTVFDAPTVRAGKELGSILYHGTSDYIKGIAPETANLFDELSKEYAIRKIINNVSKKTTGGLLRWSDIVPFMAGSGFGGLPGGLTGVAINRLAQSPATEFATAKAVQGLGKVVKPITSRMGLLPSLIKK